MRLVLCVLALGACSIGTFYIVHETNRKNRAESYAREQAERKLEADRLEKQMQEDERIRKERFEASAKEDAVRMLQRYVSREEKNLKDVIDECKIRLQMIKVDQQSLSDELIALEKEEERRAADAKRRKVKRRDKNERVDALLGSPTLNRLANTYLGEDLSAMRAEFKSHIGNLTAMSDEKTKRYAANKRKYHTTIKEADDEVSRLTDKAAYKLREARAKMGGNLDALRAKLARLRGEVEKLERLERVTTLNPNQRRTLDSLRTQVDITEAQLTSAEATEGLGGANEAHLDLTVAEAKARRTADRAITERIDEDNAVEEEMNREIAIYNAVAQYEARSLDKIRAAMLQQSSVLIEKQALAEKKLKYLSESVVSLDLMNSSEVEALRKSIAEKLTENINFDIGE